MTTREEAVKTSVGKDRQLVDALSAHQVKRLYGRGNGPHLTDWAHHALHAGLRSALAIDPPFVMRHGQP